MDDGMTIIGLIVAAIIFGGISAAIASARALQPGKWFFWGVVGGPLTLIALVVFPKSWLSNESETKKDHA